jgi:hypothetical protein
LQTTTTPRLNLLQACTILNLNLCPMLFQPENDCHMLLLFQLKPMKMAILYHVVIQDFITWLGAQLGATIGISLDLDFVQFKICRCLIHLPGLSRSICSTAEAES